MIQLNERLRVIADNIARGQTMADIGSDHGFLPLYLWENQICPQIIVTDISAGSLDKAQENARRYGAGALEFRLGDGLAVISAGEVDVVVIAGMGGVLMTKLLGADPAKTVSFQTFVLQPRNGCGKLRYWLEKTGFTTRAELLAKEGKYICEIIVVSPPKEPFEAVDWVRGYAEDIAYEVPIVCAAPCAQDSRRTRQLDLRCAFLENKRTIEEEVMAQRIAGGVAADKIAHTERRVQFIKNLL